MTARPLRPIEKHPITVIVGIVILGFALGFFLMARVASDAARRQDREQNARIAAVEQLQKALEDEARTRTTQSCLDSQRARQGTIAAWTKALDLLTPKDPAGTPQPTPTIASLRQTVEAAYPPVDCPQDEGPIVIPRPSG